MTKSAFILAAAALLLAACHGNGGSRTGGDCDTLSTGGAITADTLALDSLVTATDIWENLPDEPLLDIRTNMGTITVRLYGNTPKHRANFLKLAKSNFYDSLLFHRVISGFMVQAGDPDSKGAPAGVQLGHGGPGYTIPSAFRKEYYHKKGALAAARLGDAANPYRESSGSQFYIVQDEAACIHLDDQYTVFGETVKGLDVIDRIANVATDPYNRPLKDVVILSVTPCDGQSAQ